MKIIDSQQEFDLFVSKLKETDSLVVPIYNTDYLHPKLDEISLLWIHLLDTGQDYILTINHSEQMFKVDLALLFNCFTKKIFTVNKKDFLYKTLSINKELMINDIELIDYLDTGNKITFPRCDIQTYFKYKYPKYKINTLVPLSKWAEYFDLIKPIILNLLSAYNPLDRAYTFYNNYIIPGLYNIESRGLRVSMDMLNKSIDQSVNVDTQEELIYSQYNIYTTTGRPSNRFNSINFVALNKETGARDMFVSRFTTGALVEFDFESYHLRIIGDLIGYDLPKTPVHEYLGKLYFGKDTITSDEIEEAKKLNFKHLYGGITKQYAHIDFFKKTKIYTDSLWKSWNTSGYIESPVSGRKLYKKNYPSLNAQKLFNYLIQLLEIELNISKIDRIHEFLNQYNTKLVLYIYDAFLFDFDFGDGKECIKGIKKILEDKKYVVRKSVGSNYGNMKKI